MSKRHGLPKHSKKALRQAHQRDSTPIPNEPVEQWITEKQYSNLLPNAPCALVEILEHPNSFHGKYLLYRLLTDQTMALAWKELDKHLFINWRNRSSRQLDEEARGTHRRTWYPRIWREIFNTLRRPNTLGESRRQKRDRLERIGVMAGQLANAIANGPLDRLAYDVFPTTIAAVAFREPRWSLLDTDGRDKIARRRLREWPSVAELLHELEQEATRLAAHAISEPRIIERDTADFRSNYCVRRLTQYFVTHLHGPMHGTVARITAITLGMVDYEHFPLPPLQEGGVDIEFVKRALRHYRIRKVGA